MLQRYNLPPQVTEEWDPDFVDELYESIEGESEAEKKRAEDRKQEAAK